MSLVCREAGQAKPLTSRLRSTLASAAVAAVLAVGSWTAFGTPAQSGGETRTISLYHVHTGESLTVTYMVNGKYVPSAMKKINYIMRDWRRNEVVNMDPKTIDLVWELHADLGSKAPVHIVCGYRSAKTNGFLKRVGRNVARKSQHILGKAIDIYFPDVPTIKMRNSALVRQVGGVGYYRSSAGPTGFLHVDSGRVRHWGPAISNSQMAQIFRDYRKTVGARLNRKDMTIVAESKSKAPTNAEIAAVETAYEGADEEMAGLAEEASRTPAVPRAKPAGPAPEDVVKGYPIPKPRPKPIEVLMMAAANMKIEPASAPPPTEVSSGKQSPVSDSVAAVEAPETMIEATSFDQGTAPAKGSLAAALRDGTADEVPVIRAMMASAASQDLYWWPQQVIFNADQAVRRDGAPQQFAESDSVILPSSAEAAEPQLASATALPKLAIASLQIVSDGKGDMLVVNRQGKSSLEMPMPASLQRRQTVGQLQSD